MQGYIQREPQPTDRLQVIFDGYHRTYHVENQDAAKIVTWVPSKEEAQAYADEHNAKYFQVEMGRFAGRIASWVGSEIVVNSHVTPWLYGRPAKIQDPGDDQGQTVIMQKGVDYCCNTQSTRLRTNRPA